MRPLSRIVVGWRRLVRRAKYESELDDELQAFFQASVDAKIAAGMPAREAARAARLELGSSAAVKDYVRDIGWESHLHTLAQDVRYGLRLMRRQPGFTAVAVLTLALGIGTNTAIFSLADGMLFRPLPFASPDRLVLLEGYSPKGQVYSRVARVDFEQIRAHHTGFEGVAVVQSGPTLIWMGPDGAESMATAEGTPNLLDLLGVAAHLGRPLRLSDTGVVPRPAMLTYDGWRRRFGGDPSIVGRVVRFEQTDVEIVGVLPERFIYPLQRIAGDVLFVSEPDPKGATDPQAGVWTPVARLKPGVTLAQAQAEMDVLVQQAARAYPSTAQDRRLRVANLQFSLYQLTRPLLWLLMAAAGGVLLIACVNLASLLLARGTSREREIGIRTAMGASRLRVARQLLIESLLLATVAGTMALAIAALSFSALASFVPPRYQLVPLGLDLRAMGFTVAISIAASLLFGMLPAFRLSNVDVNASIRGTRKTARRDGFLRAGAPLVAIEVALCLVLVAGTALMTNSLARRLLVELGYTHTDAVALRFFPRPARYPTPESRFEFHHQVLDEIRRLPGVRAAGAIDVPPIGGAMPMRALRDEDWPEGSGVWSVTPGYFDAMGIPILRGRDFSDDDMRRQRPVAIVSEAIARAQWPGQDPLGQILIDDGIALTVIGLTKDIRAGYGGRLLPSVYRTVTPSSYRFWSIYAHGDGDPAALGAAMRRVPQRLDPRLVVPRAAPVWSTLGRGVEDTRFQSMLFLLFGVISLFVAAVGIYGVMAHWVSTRTREMGVRLALGAESAHVKRLVVRQAAIPLLTGLSAGLFAAFALTRQLESLLYEIKPNDPATMAAAVGILLAVGLTAAYLPARRAARVNPLEALRAE